MKFLQLFENFDGLSPAESLKLIRKLVEAVATFRIVE